MPGDVSQSYDPEFGSSANADEVRAALEHVYEEVSAIIGKPSSYILNVIRSEDGDALDIEACLTEKQWRIIRFALEYARDAI